MTPNQWATILLYRSDQYRFEEVDSIMADDAEWRAAWKLLNTWGQRAVVALAALSMEAGSAVESLPCQLPTIPALYSIPCFVWVDGRGLGLIVELSDEIGDAVTVWLWSANTYRRNIDLGTCRSVANVPRDFVLALEASAFWEQPTWCCTGPVSIPRPLARKRKDRPQQTLQKIVPTANVRPALNQIPGMTNMPKIARHKRNGDLARQVAWLKDRMQRMGHDWDDVVWQAERYSTSADCRQRIDSIVNRLCR